MSTELSKPNSAIMSAQQFHELMEQAKFFAASDLVPKDFKDKPANVLIAMEMAARLGAGWFQVIQNLHVIQGRPSFSASFQMAMVSASGRFGPIEYVMENTGPEKTVVVEYQERQGFGANATMVNKKLNYTYVPTTCRAHAVDLRSGKEVVGPPVSLDMAVEQQWVAKSGSKWQGPMRELMLTYRAGAFFARVYASDITIGMGTHTTEELRDMGGFIDIEATVDNSPRQTVAESSSAPSADPAPAPAATGTRTRAARPKATPAAEEKPAEAAPATAKPETQKASQRGEVVTYDDVTWKDSPPEATKAWRRYTLKFTKGDGTAGSADTFSDTILEPLEKAAKGVKIAIETKANPNPKYAPQLSWLEVLPDQDGDDAPPFKDAQQDGDDQEIPY